MNNRLLKICNFLAEIEKLKLSERINVLSDGMTRENDSGHSWHLAMMLLVLKKELGIKFNVDHAIKLALVHD
jgi:putative hydrolase of HD superfamily